MAKTYLELKLAKDSKGSKKCPFKCIDIQRKTKDSVGSLVNEERTLVREEAEKAEGCLCISLH